ncbi:hypothetical protein [Clostridium lundense]|uniref:hypothetical protein n=1 Tax=Clostridium lundense TaxID=319475 RepID=UPI00048A101B|nr:hypothetical protein [Clostridium lundense]
MRIGIKYCGGCNPRYDRKDIIEKLKSEYSDLIVELVKEKEIYDLVIILCGCTSCCVNHQNLNGKYGKVIASNDKDYGEILKIINKIKESEF